MIKQKPEEKPSNPVIPTSKGLSYSIYSLPRNAWTIGAFKASAIWINSACAPAQPAPPRMDTFLPRLSISASLLRSAWEGEIVGGEGWLLKRGGLLVGASSNSISPGMVITETPRCPMADWMAKPRAQGIWAGL